MPQFDMEYNSQKEDIVISEYGRNIQNIITYAKNLEDPELKQAYIEKAIELVNIMHPHNRNLAGFKEKLWNHVFAIAKYDLDVKPPEGIVIETGVKEKEVFHMPYPKETFRFRHYGNYIQEMIKKAVAMEDVEKRDEYAQIIASYMKLAYRIWNKEHYVNDEIIINDLKKLSGGVLTFEENYSVENLVSMKFSTNKRGSSKNYKGGRNNNRSKNNRSNNNRSNNNRSNNKNWRKK